jgi:ubiquinone biosynthesis protein COQ4
MAIAPSLPIRPFEAARALSALFRDPDDTAQVFVLIDSLSGLNRRRVTRRLLHSAQGARLLHKRPALAEVLSNRARLEALAPDSLGRAYLALCDKAGISAGGLVSVSAIEEQTRLRPDERLAHELLRDSHDLWHVVTGYQTDTVGEAALLAFTFAQTQNPAVGLIATMAFVDLGRSRPWVRPLLVQAFKRGRKATWFPATDWEALLARPLDEVRRELGVDAPPVYTPVSSEELKRERPQ